MEKPGAAATNKNRQCKRNLSRKTSSTSFRLRSESLNSIRLRRVFDIFDKNHDGVITVSELSQALDLLGLNADLSELESLVDSHMKPGNPGLTFEDFQGLHQSLDAMLADIEKSASGDACGARGDDDEHDKASLEESDLSEAFKVFDEDGDGYISAKELQVVLGKLGLQEGKEIDRVEMMISSVDLNNDGRVDFFEFKDMMRSVTVHAA